MDTFAVYISPIITSALAWFIIDKFNSIKDIQEKSDKNTENLKKELKEDISSLSKKVDEHSTQSIQVHYKTHAELNDLKKDMAILNTKITSYSLVESKIEEVKAGMGILGKIMETLNARTAEFGKIRLLEERMDKIEGKVINIKRS